MNDLISRQAAIDALWAERMKQNVEMEQNLEAQNYALRADNKARRNRIEEDIEIIKQLPSVQPEIIRCRDCRFSSTYFYAGETNWTCNNVEDGLGRNVSEDSYCSSAIERKEDG